MSAPEVEPKWHNVLCPQYGLSCVCAKCCPPPCLCGVIRAVERRDREAVRLEFWDAVEVVS